MDSKLEKPTSVSSSKQAETKVDVAKPAKQQDEFYKGGLGEEKKKPKEIARPSNVFVGYPGKEKMNTV